MTSLIDVIFLLLLFFMLSSTFSRFAEVEISAAMQGAGGTTSQEVMFLRGGGDDLSLNGQAVTLDALPQRIEALMPDGSGTLLISLGAAVTAQRLTDIVVALRPLPGLEFSLLEDR